MTDKTLILWQIKDWSCGEIHDHEKKYKHGQDPFLWKREREKENLLRVKCFTAQIKSQITQRHLFLGARSQHLGGGWWSSRRSLALGGEIFFAPAGYKFPSHQTLCALPLLFQDAWAGWWPGGACLQGSQGQLAIGNLKKCFALALVRDSKMASAKKKINKKKENR